jgi:hypothetical protein
VAILARGTNTPLPISIIDPRKWPKYTTPYLERFIGEDELIYPIFYGLLKAKL